MNFLGPMNSGSLIYLARRLRGQAESQVSKAHASAAASGRLEPHYVAHLCASMPSLALGWEKVMRKTHPGLHLGVASVFTHSVPKVSITTGGTCELADLLVAVVDRRRTPSTGSAVLIQAKMNTTDTLSLSGNELVQLRLLHTRPRFQIVSPKINYEFDLSKVCLPATLYGGAFHLATGSTSGSGVCSCQSEWLAGYSLPKPGSATKVALPDCLSLILVGLLIGTFGEDFECNPRKPWTSYPDDWSKLINYLLEQTASSVHMERVTGTKSGNRRSDGTIHFQHRDKARYHHSFHLGVTQYLSEFSPMKNPGRIPSSSEDNGDHNDFDLPIAEGESDGGGPSVIVFEIGDDVI